MRGPLPWTGLKGVFLDEGRNQHERLGITKSTHETPAVAQE